MTKWICGSLAGIMLGVTASAGATPPYYGQWETFDTRDGLPSDKTMAILATEDAIWVGTDRGLGVYRDGVWSTVVREDGLSHDAVLALAEDSDSGDVWIATLGGLTRYSANRYDRFTQVNSGLVNDVVYSVTVHEGQVWAATAAGTSRYDLAGNTWSIYDETNTPMREIWCYSVQGHQDRVYVAVWGGGLLEYQRSRDRWKHYLDPDGEMELDLFRDDGLVHDVVTGVAVDSMHRVWIGTYFGMSSYDGRSWRNFYDHDSPLVSNFVNYVTTQGDVCWMATDRGINASDRENWWTYARDSESGKGIATWHPAQGRPEPIELETFFPHDYVVGISFLGDDIWVATEDGIARGRLTSERAEAEGSPAADITDTSTRGTDR